MKRTTFSIVLFLLLFLFVSGINAEEAKHPLSGQWQLAVDECVKRVPHFTNLKKGDDEYKQLQEDARQLLFLLSVEDGTFAIKEKGKASDFALKLTIESEKDNKYILLISNPDGTGQEKISFTVEGSLLIAAQIKPESGAEEIDLVLERVK